MIRRQRHLPRRTPAPPSTMKHSPGPRPKQRSPLLSLPASAETASETMPRMALSVFDSNKIRPRSGNCCGEKAKTRQCLRRSLAVLFCFCRRSQPARAGQWLGDLRGLPFSRGRFSCLLHCPATHSALEQC